MKLTLIGWLRDVPSSLIGCAQDAAETQQAVELFGGRMTQDFVAERLGHSRFTELKELSVSHCSIHAIDLGDPRPFSNLCR